MLAIGSRYPIDRDNPRIINVSCSSANVPIAANANVKIKGEVTVDKNSNVYVLGEKTVVINTSSNSFLGK